MIRVALSGNIASGKSTVETIIKEKGFPVLDTDIVCHNLLNEKRNLITNAFEGYDIVQNGVISREKLGQLVFKNPKLKKQLEDILYPLVRKKIQVFFKNCKDNGAAFVAIPLLFEAEMEDLFDKILFVYADDNIRLERLIKRNNYSKDYAEIRLASQMPQADKVKKSDGVIYNNSTIEDLERQINFLIEQIR